MVPKVYTNKVSSGLNGQPAYDQVDAPGELPGASNLISKVDAYL
jgi:hypothetical protein